jgi:hypothetical protein
MKKIYVNLVIIFTIIIIISCEKKEKNISKEAEFEIVKKCLHELGSDEWEGYVVSPRFQNFQFNSFAREYNKQGNFDGSKAEILNSLQWSKEHFIDVQQEVNKTYLKKNNPLLLKLSKSTMHNDVILFSGIHENLVFVNIVNYCNAVKVLDLASPSFNKNQRFSSVACFAFILKDGNVKKMLKLGTMVLELQCNDYDIRVDDPDSADLQSVPTKKIKTQNCNNTPIARICNPCPQRK